MPPQIVPKSILGPPWTQICAKDGPREPPTTDVHDFLSILAPFFIDFGSIFDRFYMIFDPASQVRPTLESNGTSDERYESITIAEPHSLFFGLAGFRLRITICLLLPLPGSPCRIAAITSSTHGGGFCAAAHLGYITI